MGNTNVNKIMLSSIEKQRYDKIVEIIEKYPQILQEDLSQEIQSTPLARAVWRNDIYLVDILIKNGADVDNGGSSSITPLMWACRRDNAYLVSNLVEYGAKITIKSNEGYTALDYAIVHGNYRPALFLFEFFQETLEYFDYYQFAKDRDYRYVNYEIMLSNLKQKVPYQQLPNIFKKPEKKKLIDPVVDPRESWKQLIVRQIDFKEPPLVERTELPDHLQPQNRFWGKVRQSLNGLAVQPSQRMNQGDEGQNLQPNIPQEIKSSKSQDQEHSNIHIDQVSVG
ncbi:unnamed protein product [Paramecium primaurelia]|uniref:Ankyrin repeat protein n=1 Tax=Paramecium primaurelia TaxID=5886 RepID=A0A8S1N169_PARPR|nr:unnamed protein product [Paramecium primaurelia]